ncbi:MAG: ATP-dependent sacrificial sulfur transferase LarE [Desulfobulbus oligotrophicus]|nr:ATP-dependent sacrificial sulfur transferase LarE [Desulfobulbus oligotrophicus]
MSLKRKQKQLQSILQGYGRVAVAFSGGADSSLLLKCALDVLGGRHVLALFARSALQTPGEIEHVQQWAVQNNCEQDLCLDIVEVNPLQWDTFITNPDNRCYHCKRQLYQLFRTRMQERGYSYLLDGTNCDDRNSHRPGLRAIDELQVQTPLVASGFDKNDVRGLSRQLNLTTWNRPSASCLATRIPTGMSINEERLQLVALFEEGLRRFGFIGCRVYLNPHRHDTVHIAIQNNEFSTFSEVSIRLAVLDFFRRYGVDSVLLDLAGRG